MNTRAFGSHQFASAAALDAQPRGSQGDQQRQQQQQQRLGAGAGAGADAYPSGLQQMAQMLQDQQAQRQQQQQLQQWGPTTRTHRVVIDSRSRNIEEFPSPAKYEATLNNDLYNVTSMRLAVADVPFPAYLIGPVRCGVPVLLTDAAISNASISAVARLTVGDYANAGDLAAELAAALNAAARPAQTFAVAHSARTDSFTIRSTAPFALPFAGRAADTPAAALGFGTDRDYASAPDPALGDHALTAPFRCSLSGGRYVILSISPNAELLTSPTDAINRSFALLPITPMLSVNNDDESYQKRWTPALGRVSRITLRFTDADGNPYDFQNQDHRIELSFECNVNRGSPPI